MTPTEFSNDERRVLSYLSRGASKDTAVRKIATFFKIDPGSVQSIIDKLRRDNFVIESRSISGVVVYTTSPLKVKQAMLDPLIIAQLTEMERGTRASGFKKQAFDANTGAVVAEDSRKKKKESDLGFDII
jgi:DNA-binding MarR family transcriptional regulator